MRAGYQQMHVSNMLSTVANILSLGMLLLLWRRETVIAWFVVAVYFPLTVLMLMDLARQFHERRYLFPPPAPASRDLREGGLSGLLQTSGVAWIAQLHGFLVAHASVLMVSHAAGTDETAAFGTLMRGALLVYAVVGLYVWPMVPALSDAIARKEWVWARRSWLRSVWATLAIAVPSALALGVMGPWIVRVWLGAEVPVPPLMAAGMGLFLLGFNLNFLGFNTCLALGATRWLAWTYLAEAALFVLLSILLAPLLGATGIALALGLSSVAINFWIMPLRSLQRLRGLP
jgi:O-antigen/teichoic acid export membrane protein